MAIDRPTVFENIQVNDVIGGDGFAAGLGAQGLKNNGDGIIPPATAPAAAVGSAGALTGTYGYTVTYVTAIGETAPWPGTATTVAPSSQRINLSNIPVGPAGVLARRLYRTLAAAVDPKD